MTSRLPDVMTVTVVPFATPWPNQGPRHLYVSTAQVTRLVPIVVETGDMVLSWGPISDIVDTWLDVPALLKCRIDVGFTRRGVDLKAPLVTGRAPDRVGLCFFDPVTAANGALLVKAGDRLVMTDGPVYGTWEIRAIPDPAQAYFGTHHIEVQVIEVAQQLAPGSITPFPGGAP